MKRGDSRTTRPYIYLSTSPHFHFLCYIPVLMTLYVDELHRENRKERRQFKEAQASLPALHSFPFLLLSSRSQLCSAVPTFICCHSYPWGRALFFLLRSGSLLNLSLTLSSPYVRATPLPEQSRAMSKEPLSCSPLEPPPRLSPRLYCLCEQHTVAVFMVSDLVCRICFHLI